MSSRTATMLHRRRAALQRATNGLPHRLVLLAGLTACGFPRPADVPDDSEVSDAGLPADASPIGPFYPSCITTAPICGPTHNDSCCTSPLVPAGTYYRVFDYAGDQYSRTMDLPATVSAFRLDKYEVTVGRFRAFIDAGQGTQDHPPQAGAGAHPAIPGTGWDAAWDPSLASNTGDLKVALSCDATNHTWTDTAGPNEEQPINCVSWYDAMAFCLWDGGFLPTEAEWNFAAAGGEEQRAYPWSHPAAVLLLDATRANSLGTGPGTTLPVGSLPAGNGRWGHADLAGNVSEWVYDWRGGYVVPCINCVNNQATSGRVSRSGGYTYGASEIRTTFFRDYGPFYRATNLGVRCARTPEQS